MSQHMRATRRGGATLVVLTRRATIVIAVLALALIALPLEPGGAQAAPSPRSRLDSVVALAQRASPRLRAARARVDAALARIAPAGARPDPMLMAGVQNLPVTKPGFGDEMTMKMVGISQTLVLGGRRGLAKRAAEREADAVRAELEAATLELARDVRVAWYEVAYADRALEIVERSQRVLVELVRATELRYGTGATTAGAAMGTPSAPTASVTTATPAAPVERAARPRATMRASGGMSGMSDAAASVSVPAVAAPSGTMGSMPTMSSTPARLPGADGAMPSMRGGGAGGLEDVVRARIELTRLGEQASALLEARRAALARLNSLLDRPTDTPLDSATVPERIRRAAVADAPAEIRFASATLGSRAAGSPLPPLAELQERAVRENASIRSHEQAIRAQEARAALAGRARIPDVDVALEYGQRDGMPDMMSAVVSIPLPLQRRRVQDAWAASARAELAALQAEHHEEANRLRAEAARLYGGLERDRVQLALLVKAVIPQARVATDAALASFRSGRGDLVAVLGAQVALFDYEASYHRTLNSFATTLATLEQMVGGEVLP